MSSRRLFAVVGALAVAFGAELAAQAITEAEALALACPGACWRREELELTTAQRTAVGAAAGQAAPARIVRHVATKDGAVVAIAWVDSRTVRTHGQTLLVVVDPKGTVRRVELLAFDEPKRYRPRAEFFAAFVGRSLDDELRLRRAIKPIAGATMSAVAAVAAVRTVLAAHAVLPVAR